MTLRSKKGWRTGSAMGRAVFLLSPRGLLPYLKTRFRVGVVSNFFGNLRVVFEDAGLAGSVEVMIDSGRVGIVSRPRATLSARPGAAPPASGPRHFHRGFSTSGI